MSRTHRIAFTAVSWAVVMRGSRRVPMTREVAREMRSGAEFARQLDQALSTTAAESISVADAVAGGYLERLRLGLGSPFRLIDYALADPLLTDSVRHLVPTPSCSRRSMGTPTTPRVPRSLLRVQRWPSCHQSWQLATSPSSTASLVARLTREAAS
jgi:hypothetical protein